MKPNNLVTITYIEKPFENNVMGLIPAFDVENEEKIIEEIREILGDMKYSGGMIQLSINEYTEQNIVKEETNEIKNLKILKNIFEHEFPNHDIILSPKIFNPHDFKYLYTVYYKIKGQDKGIINSKIIFNEDLLEQEKMNETDLNKILINLNSEILNSQV